MGAPAGFAFPVFGIHRRYLQRGEKKFASPDLGTTVSLVSFTREEAALPLGDRKTMTPLEILTPGSGDSGLRPPLKTKWATRVGALESEAL
jgi:hypothetical protein